MPRCSGSKPDGSRCEHIVSAPQTYCYAHDPARKEQRRRAASKAARSKPGNELGGVKRVLRELAEDVLAGRVDRGNASVAAQVLGVFLRAVETERKVKEQEELEARLEALERATDREGRRWG